MLSISHHPDGGDMASQTADDAGLQVKLMGLKVQYTFDADRQERCLARWPNLLHVQTYPIDEQNRIGIIDLKICLQTIAQCSPELISDTENDYTVYAYDYSEPDVPLVGQGMLSWGLNQEPSSSDNPSLVTGRITKNPLAVVSNGIRETLEVKFKLTLVTRTTRSHPILPHQIYSQTASISRASPSAPPENSDWQSFTRSNLNTAQTLGAPIGIGTMATSQNQQGQPNYEARPSSQGPLPTSERRTTSVEPTLRDSVRSFAMGIPDSQVIAPAPAKGGKIASRPASRASSKPPSGRPRGRPRKKPLQVEGSTSGIEDVTDADDGPPRSKKRAMTTKVERNNAATFSAMPESLRVVASTAGSIRNIRPVAIAGDARAGNHQEVPRAPTPVPIPRLPGFPQARTTASSGLSRESMPRMEVDEFTSTYGQGARSPAESAGISPSQIYSDEASPADIGSSPPGPRSTLFSARSSPTPSSPILPPMPSARVQPDSGFMSGGLDSRVDDDAINQAAISAPQKAVMAAKAKPRRSRAKKAPATGQSDLIIHTEVPGPPELLPQTSIYNPPYLIRKNSEAAKTPVVNRPPSLPPFPEPSERMELEAAEKQPMEKATPTEVETTQGGAMNLGTATPMDLVEDQNQLDLDSFDYDSRRFAASVAPSLDSSAQPTVEQATAGLTDPPKLADPVREPLAELELPMVPASDHNPPHSMLTMPLSESSYSQSDANGSTDGKSNKNVVKRLTIKQKLEEAVLLGQLPSYCNNCGAIQTPTWRKIWKQVRTGVPAYHEYSEKPGFVTAITILARDASDHPTAYEIIKKSLGPTDKKSAWTEVLLCNPCGIWFSKFKQHRPADKWEKDESRLAQTRKKRPNNSGQPRSKKARTKSDTQTTLTSEAFLPTDPLGPPDGPTPLEDMATIPVSQSQHQGEMVEEVNRQGSTHSRASTHSRGSGTFDSPIAVDDELGPTRRVLFPSPRKEGEQRVLGEVSVNIVQTSPEFLNAKGDGEMEKENNDLSLDGVVFTDKDFADIFGTPPRPSTPPPNANNSGPFKTPTRATPGHRPVTRSVTRSMRSVRSISSPSRILMMDHTPTRTPHTGVAKRHSPNGLMPSHLLDEEGFNTPFARPFGHFLSGFNQDAEQESEQPEEQEPLPGIPINLDEYFGRSEPVDFGRAFGMPAVSPEPKKIRERSPGHDRRVATYFAMMEAGTVHIPDVVKGRPVD
ncbi:uncharacterized protein GGS22DRAFT_74910 [Annulohypoxylon maeteangense]|uniref:uncharacterized protein n=1 Tax=Annulohypoxylon maeteangense TaxID=1927788 RepID=UPI002008199E|nr:uncharacterized protein GGS22DRAFT_74910 [Annulohypoxylon maeteangense]KAI0881042.1 hypothetical protein GGS22DRAFT_74910 [Annulohypoxylon maeteangense]